MEIKRLKADDILDPETETHFAFHSTLRGTTSIHCHDFFEIFLMSKGNITHCVNGAKQQLCEGSLVFIRPDDVHYYEVIPGVEFTYINLAFLQKSVYALFEYLGEGFSSESILNSRLPPLLLLSKSEKEALQKSLEKLNSVPFLQKGLAKARLRAFLAELFTKYFLDGYTEQAPELPPWLDQLFREMEKEENFSVGLPALLEISGRTHEYLCCVFKKYLNKTPTQYINEIRLQYAANILLNTDKSILAVSMDAGFNNLSHFYHLFKKQFKSTPLNFRKTYKRSVIPVLPR